MRIADLGRCALSSGATLENCRVGYRLSGTPNADTSNVIVALTWFSGTTASLAQSIGPGKLYDTNRYFVVSIDALGNGVSSSPSNTPGEFPAVTMRDMVNTQYRLLTEVLRIRHVKAVSGLSMGAMQTFEWLGAYPDFMDRAIAITGTPRPSTFDQLFWHTQKRILEEYQRCGGCFDASEISAYIDHMMLWTPAFRNRTTSHERAAEYFAAAKRTAATRFNAGNRLAQTNAILALDAMPAATNSRARVLIIVAQQDLTVNPQPARDFAQMNGSRIIELSGDCGHIASSCELAAIVLPAVHAFLAEQRP